MPRKKKGAEVEEHAKKSQSIIERDTKQTIIAVIMFGIGIIAFLSLIHAAGSFGEGFANVLYMLAGWGAWFIPVVLWILGIGYYQNDLPKFTRNLIGTLLSTLGILGLFNLVIEGPDVMIGVAEGSGGGYLGYVFAHWMYGSLGFWGSLVVLLLIVIVGMITAFNATIEDILHIITPPEKDEYEALKKAEQDETDDLSEDEEITEEEEEEYDEEDSSEENEEDIEDEEELPDPETTEIPQNTQALRSKKQYRSFKIPVNLLEEASENATAGDIELNKLRIKRKLENFNIPVEMGDAHTGPSVTQYTLRPMEGIKLSKITALQNDIALALAAQSIRIEAPIPGKSLVGIEIPNQGIATVRLKSLIDSQSYKKSDVRLPLTLGKDVTGNPIVVGLEKMPHLLIAGATGSGKSVCINALILSMMYANTPDELKLIMVDPKRVELSGYNNSPYLIAPVITETNKTVNALKWAVGEMEKRYALLEAEGKRNIESFNAGFEQNKLQYIVIVIDELADLMAVSGKEVEALIVRIAQKARAVGIHLLLATQRPSVDVITGLIKANIPGRVAFAVNSIVDSRTILDSSGAEKLLGKGDMLFMCNTTPKPRRLQGAFVGDRELEEIIGYSKNFGNPDYVASVTEKPTGPVDGMSGIGEDCDPLYEEAMEAVIEAKRASTSLLQRKLRIGYGRAARIMDELEKNGVIGPADGSRPREILAAHSETNAETENDTDGELTEQTDDGYDEHIDRS